MADYYLMLDDVDASEPQTNRLDYLFWLKAKYPSLVVNLFCIPQRSPDLWLYELSKTNWIQVCMHSWDHNEEEEITPAMLEKWKFTKVYKGPNWKLPGKTKEKVLAAGFRLIEKPLPDNYFQGHIWAPADLEKIRVLLESGVECKKLYAN